MATTDACASTGARAEAEASHASSNARARASATPPGLRVARTRGCVVVWVWSDRPVFCPHRPILTRHTGPPRDRGRIAVLDVSRTPCVRVRRAHNIKRQCDAECPNVGGEILRCCCARARQTTTTTTRRTPAHRRTAFAHRRRGVVVAYTYHIVKTSHERGDTRVRIRSTAIAHS
jgi:hypothetical protein